MGSRINHSLFPLVGNSFANIWGLAFKAIFNTLFGIPSKPGGFLSPIFEHISNISFSSIGSGILVLRVYGTPVYWFPLENSVLFTFLIKTWQMMWANVPF